MTKANRHLCRGGVRRVEEETSGTSKGSYDLGEGGAQEVVRDAGPRRSRHRVLLRFIVPNQTVFPFGNFVHARARAPAARWETDVHTYFCIAIGQGLLFLAPRALPTRTAKLGNIFWVSSRSHRRVCFPQARKGKRKLWFLPPPSPTRAITGGEYRPSSRRSLGWMDGWEGGLRASGVEVLAITSGCHVKTQKARS